jgi:hypothetical protein
MGVALQVTVGLSMMSLLAIKASSGGFPFPPLLLPPAPASPSPPAAAAAAAAASASQRSIVLDKTPCCAYRRRNQPHN